MEHEHSEIKLEKSKYEQALALYETDINEEEVRAAVEKIVSEELPGNNTAEVKKALFGCIDLTTLKTTDSEESVMRFAERVNKFDEEYCDFPSVAAVCVYPNMAQIVHDTLEVESVNVACVAGGFPSSQTFLEVKTIEAGLALHDGADEIDMVISVGKFLSGDYEGMCDEIDEMKSVCGEHHLKVILETGALGSLSNVAKASILAMYSGADFIKTSTGKLDPAATPEAAYVMCRVIKAYYEKTGRRVGFKPAGGINTVNDALCYYTIVAEVLGSEWLDKSLFRLGTSRLANLLLSDILGEETKFF